jgi:hypothetical protein
MHALRAIDAVIRSYFCVGTQHESGRSEGDTSLSAKNSISVSYGRASPQDNVEWTGERIGPA